MVLSEADSAATARAASGGLAQLSVSPDVCQRILDEKQGLTILRELIVRGGHLGDL
jgi:hypothetical protein